jgi:hypothetical protein
MDDWNFEEPATQIEHGQFGDESAAKPKKWVLVTSLAMSGLLAVFATIGVTSYVNGIKSTGTSPTSIETPDSNGQVSNTPDQEFSANDLYKQPDNLESLINTVSAATVLVECRYSSSTGNYGTGWGIGLKDDPSTTDDDAEPYELITNWHVIEKCIDLKGSIFFYFASSPDVPHAATLYNYDDSDSKGRGFGDLALLTTATSVPSLPLSDSAPKSGQWALAMGNPYSADEDALNNHVTIGIVSDYLAKKKWVVTSAEVNPGNSGGPLINSRGQVMAVNTWSDARTNVQGMFYSIAVSQLCNEIIECDAASDLSW